MIARLSEEDGKPHLPPGSYLVSDGSDYPQTEGQFLLNADDTLDTRAHHLTTRLNGCCGLDGMDGPNTLCAQGHEVGTTRSDCWMAHSVALDPRAVTMVVQG